MTVKPVISFVLLAAVLTSGQSPTSGLDLANFDATVRPQDDLFRAVNGGWLARTAMSPIA